MELTKTLQDIFGLDKFRNNQEEIIRNILKKEDTLVIMPTGGGKSLTYQLPGYIMEGTTIVISPLISLMEDQINGLKKKGLKAYLFASSLTNDEKVEIYNKIEEGEVDFLYVAPERFEYEEFITNLKEKLTINLIVIDEAHCISTWGNDFRESYRKLSTLKKIFKNVPIIALTATADKIVREDICNILKIKEKNTYTTPVERTNLIYEIEKKKGSGIKQVEQIVKQRKGEKGIIYCFTRKEVTRLAKELRAKKYSVRAYHAGLKSTVKEKAMTEFMEDETDVIVATIAFGMGVDKSNIRYIIHKDFPKDIESYYQETGRAGRDGKNSNVIMLFSDIDVRKLNWVVGNNKLSRNKLDLLVRFTKTTYCKKKIINWYFDNENHQDNCGKCNICNQKIGSGRIKRILISLNNNINKTFEIEELENLVINDTGISKKDISDYLWQLVFSNNLMFDKVTNYITVHKKIDDFIFQAHTDIDDNYLVSDEDLLKEKEIGKRAKRKKKTTKTKKTSKAKTTTKTKKTLSEEQKAKMKAGREKAKAKRDAKKGKTTAKKTDKVKATKTTKAKKTLSEEQKAKMKAGREKAKAKREEKTGVTKKVKNKSSKKRPLTKAQEEEKRRILDDRKKEAANKKKKAAKSGRQNNLKPKQNAVHQPKNKK